MLIEPMFVEVGVLWKKNDQTKYCFIIISGTFDLRIDGKKDK